MTILSSVGRRVAGRRPGGALRPPAAVALGVAGVASFIALWAVGSAATRFIPSIAEIAEAVPGFLATEDIAASVVPSLLRVVASLAVAVVLGVTAAAILDRGGFWSQVVARYVDLAIGLPSTVMALLALMIFKRSEVGVIVVVAIAVFPFIAISIRQGLATASAQLADMAKVYRLGRLSTFARVTVPHMIPYIMSSVRNEYAHAWRVVVLAEVFAVNSGIGRAFTSAFDRFHIDDVVIWLVIFIVLLLGTEYLILRPLEKFTLRWRGASR